MKYAVIKLQGSQYKVSEGKEIFIDRVSDKNPEPDVLLYVDEDNVLVGYPVIEKANIVIKILENKVLGTKIDVMKYKAKSRYRKKIGFRPQYTKLLIDKISLEK